jgi:hypothetical protein
MHYRLDIWWLLQLSNKKELSKTAPQSVYPRYELRLGCRTGVSDAFGRPTYSHALPVYPAQGFLSAFVNETHEFVNLGFLAGNFCFQFSRFVFNRIEVGDFAFQTTDVLKDC